MRSLATCQLALLQSTVLWIIIAIGIVFLAICLTCVGLYCRLLKSRRRTHGVEEALLDFDSVEIGPDASFSDQVGYDQLKDNVKRLRANSRGRFSMGSSADGSSTTGSGRNDSDLIDNDTVSEVEIGEQVGRGSYGIVHKGKYRGRDVAIKLVVINEEDRLNSSTMNAITMDFQSECQTMCLLAHPNVVQFLGFSTRPKVTIIQEFVAGGNLHDYLKAQLAPLEYRLQLSMLLDLTSGPSIAHKIM